MSTTVKTPILVLAVFFLAANLRAPIVAVGPILHEIGASLYLDKTILGLLGTLPVLTFAIMSPFVKGLASRVGLEKAILFGVIAIGLGGLLRVGFSTTLTLILGTIILCAGIAIGNVLLSAAIRRDFPRHMAQMSSFQLLTFGISQSLAAGLSVPITIKFGWQWGLGIWSIFALPAFLCWFYLVKKNNIQTRLSTQTPTTINIWKSALAWKISVYMGLQSLMFYTLANWLPLFLQSRGMDAKTAGYTMTVFQIIAIPTAVMIPIITKRYQQMQHLLSLSAFLMVVGLIGFWYLPLNWVWVASMIIGIGCAASFTFCLILFALRGKDAIETAALSGMGQTMGYFIAAIGPIALGYLLNHVGSWGVPWTTLTLIAVGIVIVGQFAGKAEEL